MRRTHVFRCNSAVGASTRNVYVASLSLLLFQDVGLWLATAQYRTRSASPPRAPIQVWSTSQKVKRQAMQFSFRACFVWVGGRTTPSQSSHTIAPSFPRSNRNSYKRATSCNLSSVKKGIAKLLCELTLHSYNVQRCVVWWVSDWRGSVMPPSSGSKVTLLLRITLKTWNIVIFSKSWIGLVSIVNNT